MFISPTCCSDMEDRTQPNDELNDLKTSNPLLPPNADTASTLEIIPVHDDMYGQVQGDRDPRHRGTTSELSVAQKGRCTVVIAVEEGCLKLALGERFCSYIQARTNSEASS